MDETGEALEALETLDVVVRGRVQGVGFRWFAQREATLLGLSGWVANEPDGSVRCLATGPRPSLEAFLGRLQDGPPSGRVDSVAPAWRPAAGGASAGFAVRSGAHRGD
jgi:acylphosphatase